uniref:Ig-like domain-containing protein n=1 Tax=Esox lucius TaxID=8010 RepID=A0A3P8YU57_ESOLU
MENFLVYVLGLVLLNFPTDLVADVIVPSTNPLAVGSNVTLNVVPQSPINIGTWSHESTIILFVYPTGYSVTDIYQGRISFNRSSSELFIRSLQLNDSGQYILQGFEPSKKTAVTLIIQEPISNVTLRANTIDVVEQNDTVILTCSASSGSSPSYRWLNGSSLVRASDIVRLVDGNSTLILDNVTRYDKGPFKCEVFNGISNETSQPIYLNVRYGPTNLTMRIIPEMTTGHTAYRTGSDITLSCSAESVPPASYMWRFNGASLENPSPQLSLLNVTENQTGSYTCLAHNNVTLRFALLTRIIKVVEPISAVTLNHVGKLPILDQSFTLHCEVTGPVDRIYWLKNGQLISLNNKTLFYMDNNTMVINSIQFSDSGEYYCEAVNAANNLTSKAYQLVVNFGPERPAVTSLDISMTGHNVTFSCSASSQPPSQFSWFFNGSQVATGSVYEAGPLTLASQGEYTCVAFNNVTGRNSTASKTLTVVAPVTMTMIKVEGAQPILNKTFSLTCETTGTVFSIQWMRNGLLLHDDETTQFSTDNKTLTFNFVQHSDNGDYKCSAFNPFSNMTSPDYRLIINFGPEMAIIAGPALGETGHNMTFNCSASSQPPSQFSWFFNGSLVATGSVYEAGPLTLASQGEYTCVAFNNVTGRNSTASKTLTVVVPIISVAISTSGGQAVEGDSFTMTCNVIGQPVSIQWWKNSILVHLDNTTHISMDNRILTFNPLQQSDQGEYKCVTSNGVNNRTSNPYTLLVNYGPEQPIIVGVAIAQTKQRVTFNCSASSQPPSQFSWFFNGSLVATGSVYETGPLTLASQGEYTCVAFNNVTGRNSTASKTLTVVEAIKSLTVNQSTIPIASANLTLTCDAVGIYDTIYWTKNSLSLDLSNTLNTGIIISNNSLHFVPVKVSNDGIYQCVAINVFGPYPSPQYQLLVNYGPLSVNVSLQGPMRNGSEVTYTMQCYADSRPTTEYHWKFNNQSLPETGPSMVVVKSLKNAGIYTCVAINPVTKIEMSNTISLDVTGHSPAPPFLSRVCLMLILLALSHTL